MTPSAARFLEKANRLLKEAETMLGVGLGEAAGRSAYLASFHAAQALIFERDGKIFKTHSGVHTEFLRLTRDDPRLDSTLRTFLSRSYNLKAVADYEIGPISDVSGERASAAVDESRTFIARLTTMILEPPS